MPKGKSKCAGHHNLSVRFTTLPAMIWNWLQNSILALRRKVKSTMVVLGIFVMVFIAGVRSTKLSFVRDFFDLPPTWDSALLQDSQIQAELSTLSEMRSILDDIPSDLTKAQLVESMNRDAEYRKRLTDRLVRLLGVRNEKVASLKASLVQIIDGRLKPLYVHELGTYTFRAEKTEEFASCVEDMKDAIEVWEQELLQRREKLSQ